MNGTFVGTYEKKIEEFDKLIKNSKNISDKQKYENELNEYVCDCMPYLVEYSLDHKTEEYDPIFNTMIKKGVQRKDIYKKYLVNVENYKGTLGHEKTKININNLNCKSCNSGDLVKDHVAAIYVCKKCGVCEEYLGDELSYREEQEQTEKVVTSGYKKENHLNEWILQFQGRESTNIPQEVIDQLRSEFKKMRIKNINEISKEKVKQLLKKLRLTKYYEHSTYITHILNGLNPPYMTQELEDKLRMMFREIQEPFVKHCPPDRNNFLSYSYVLYKFCELLEEDDYLPFFPLLKAKDKLRQQDEIWKNICNEVRWEYIPTV
jgi:hypothetical protein